MTRPTVEHFDPDLVTYRRTNATSDRTSAWFAYYPDDRVGPWYPFAVLLRDERPGETGPAYWIAVPVDVEPGDPIPVPFSAASAVPDEDDPSPFGVGRTREHALTSLLEAEEALR